MIAILCFAVSMVASAENYTGECGAEGDNITTIGENAVINCTELKTVTIGEGITDISDYAFNLNVNLTSLLFILLTVLRIFLLISLRTHAEIGTIRVQKRGKDKNYSPFPL